MKILSSLIVVIMLMIQCSFAQDVQSEFTLTKNVSALKEGDIFEAMIRVWPLDSADLSQFKKLEKTTLFNALYLAQITSLGVSPNNADVVELKGLFIAKSAKVQPTFIFKYNNQDITLSSGVLSIKELGDKKEDFYVLSQSLNSSYLWIAYVVIGLILLIVIIRKRESLIALVKPNKAKIEKKKYDHLFKVADKREDFELLYKEKGNWIQLLVETTPAHHDFLRILNQHQFKKNWSNEEYADVRASFDVIRRSFEK